MKDIRFVHITRSGGVTLTRMLIELGVPWKGNHQMRFTNPNQFTHIIVLRHPAERIISLYRAIRRKNADTNKHFDAVNSMTLAEFVDSEIFCSLDNDAIRYLTNLPTDDAPIDTWIGEPDLDKAKRALDQFDLVAFTHLLPLFAKQLGELYDLPAPRVEYYNSTEGSSAPPLAFYEPETIRRLFYNNRFDMRLFHYALERWATR